MPPMTNVIPMPVDWVDLLIHTKGKDSHPKSNLANCVIALTKAPEWIDTLQWNEFTHKLQLCRKTPWGKDTQHEWDDNDDRAATQWLQHHDIDVPVHIAHDAVLSAAYQHSVNPLFDYLNDLQWDGWCRIDDWLTYYMGVTESDYSRAVGRAWLISAVARTYQPGCKADCCLILEGPQGKGKSTALKLLAGGPEYFSDYMSEDLGNKEAAILCIGAWIIEFAELEGIMHKPNKVETVKAFLSRTDDRYRPVHGHHPVRVPRQCVFAATTNKDTYMHDESGNRRFWPVRCTEIDVKGLARDRDQIWAEAVHHYRDLDTAWWLPPEIEALALTETRNRLDSHPWQDAINAFLSSRGDVAVSDILLDCLGKKIDVCGPADAMQVARCLKVAGWDKYRVPGKGNIRWRKS